MCYKWTNILAALLVLIFNFWDVAYSKWIVSISAFVLLILALISCNCCDMCKTQPKVVAVKSKKKRR
jgi:hypothetical protein